MKPKILIKKDNPSNRAIISLFLHLNLQFKKTIDFVILIISTVPIKSSPKDDGAMNFTSKEMVTHDLFPLDL